MKKEFEAFVITLFSLGSLLVLLSSILIIKTRLDKQAGPVAVEPTVTTVAPVLEMLTLSEVVTAENFRDSSDFPSSFLINDFQMIYQNPELPTGCEVTSLAMLLQFLGYHVDKMELADNYLTKADFRTASIYDAFIGNPRWTNSYGCFSPVIVECAVSYLKEQNTRLKIYNYTGSEFSTLLRQVANGHPCVVWTTISLLEPSPADKWIVDDEICQWYSQEHCMVLIGYDLEQNQVTAADPLHGIKTYDLTLFQTRYEQMFKQAVCIY